MTGPTKVEGLVDRVAVVIREAAPVQDDPTGWERDAAAAALGVAAAQLNDVAAALVEGCVAKKHLGAVAAGKSGEAKPCPKCVGLVRNVRFCAGVVLPEG